MPEQKNKYDTEYNRQMFPDVVKKHGRKKKPQYGIRNNMRLNAAQKLHKRERESGKTVFGKIAEYVPEWAR